MTEFYSSSHSSLVPTQMYYYQTGDEKYGWSGEFSFRAPPAPSPDVTTRVVAYGDMGFGEPDQSSEHWEEQPALKTIDLVTKEVSNGNVDVVLHIGDIRCVGSYVFVVCVFVCCCLCLFYCMCLCVVCFCVCMFVC